MSRSSSATLSGGNDAWSLSGVTGGAFRKSVMLITFRKPSFRKPDRLRRRTCMNGSSSATWSSEAGRWVGCCGHALLAWCPTLLVCIVARCVVPAWVSHPLSFVPSCCCCSRGMCVSSSPRPCPPFLLVLQGSPTAGGQAPSCAPEVPPSFLQTQTAPSSQK